MTPDPALLAALASAPSIEPDPSQVGKVGVWIGEITDVREHALKGPPCWDARDATGGDDWSVFMRCVAILDPPDPRDAEIARLRARVAELEAGR